MDGKMAKNRIQKEFKEMTSNNSLYSVGLDQNNTFKWNAIIRGPEDTPYAGGLFSLEIIFPTEYPFKPPTFTFKTKIYHPNINAENGAICVDILKSKWTPSLTVEKVLLSIGLLLAEPNPDDPLEVEIGKLFKKNKSKFEKKAREWTNKYANK